ncbi:MAG TPA: AAA family ATPase [Candidatus Angelobacter sp.]|nr:AAA family ATPase [Candidatus Angelobacter sp.]
MIWNPRGSRWHRWDPHLHAPGTLLADQFAGDWEAYLTAVENGAPVIRALGVTDYFCIQTYKEVRKRKDAGRLPNVFFLFPNVEMRLEIKTAKNHGINLHLLFSPDDPHHESTIERILGRLHFRFQEQDYACNRQELIALGRVNDPKQTNEDGAHRTGANLFKVSFPELQKLFREEQKWLSKNCLVAVAGSLNDGTAGLQEDASFAALRQEVERFADIIFASTPSQREFWLGKTPKASRETIEEKYKALKPCMHGSDAHWVEKVGAPAEDRYCWVKGDLAFETLRQVVLEPDDRVRIGPTAPLGPSPGETMRSVKLNDTPFVTTPELQLNSGLIAIIGSRGSGKTALMEFLAAGASALTATAMDSSFLQRAADLLGDAAVEITWADDETHSATLHDPWGWRTNDAETAKVCYLSQQFVERLCSSAGLATELRREMERVVFETTDQSDRMQCDTFAELSNLLLAPAAENRSELEASIKAIGDSILKEDLLREQVPIQADAIKAQTAQIEKLKKEMKEILPKDKQVHADKLVLLEAEYKRAESKVEGLRLRKQHLTDLLADVQHTTQTREPNRFREQQSRFVGAGLSAADWDAFRMEFEGNPVQLIQNAVKVLDAEILTAIQGDPQHPLDAAKVPASVLPLKQLGTVRDASKTAVGIDAQKQKKYDELQRTIGQMESALRKLEAEHLHARGATERRKQLQQQRRDEYVEVFNTYVEEEKVLSELYGPLKEILAASKGTLSKLAFVVEREVSIDAWVKQGEDLLDLRRDSKFRGHGALLTEAKKYLLQPWATGGPTEVAEAMDKFRSDFQEDFKKAIPEFENQEDRRNRRKEISAWLYSTDHIKIQYGIMYEGTPIERLSPGTRGIVLLLLYLAVDTHDMRPLFIDQPEENLDPRSVFTELVPHFRSAKQRRQVVIVTHNANLVVNTDADQIIIATSERKDDRALPSISYASGSIENPEIRRAVCRLLEGGRRAFLDRERRYRIHSSDVAPNDEASA